MNSNHCPPELVLAGIIRQVGGKRELSPDALAEAILAHPGSCWGPAQPAAPWPELSENPPLPEAYIGEKVEMTSNELLQLGYLCGWLAARAELQRQREQAEPPPPAAWPEISDGLIAWLMRDLSQLAATTVSECAIGRPFNPVPTARVCLLAVLDAAAKDGAG